jgi:hypothetical protein
MMVMGCAHMATPILLQSVPMHLKKGQFLPRKNSMGANGRHLRALANSPAIGDRASYCLQGGEGEKGQVLMVVVEMLVYHDCEHDEKSTHLCPSLSSLSSLSSLFLLKLQNHQYSECLKKNKHVQGGSPDAGERIT